MGAAALLWSLADDDPRTPQYLEVAAETPGALLPGRCAAGPSTSSAHRSPVSQAALRHRVVPAQRHLIAMAGPPPPRFDRCARARRLAARAGRAELHPATARWPLAGRPPGPRAAESIERPDRARSGADGVAVAVSASSVVRRLGRQLERLKAGVEQVGNDLSARVKVEGRGRVRGA